MRLVCPNCVAQYEVADGTIPDSGRDVQCANCGHVWFQDAAFKLSTDDMTYVPQRRTAPRSDDDDDDGDAPGMFHSMRAAGASKDEVTSRTLPEVGNNVLDILRSEAAFSSRRRAEALAESGRAAPPDAPDTQASEPPVGTRAGDRPPEAAPPAATPAQDTGRAEDDFRALAWRHMRGAQDTDPAAGDAEHDLPSDPADADATGHTPPAGDWLRQASADRADDEDRFGGAYDAADRYDEQDFDDPDHDVAEDDTYPDEIEAEPDRDVTGLAADDAKRIAEAAVARSHGSGLTAQPDAGGDDDDDDDDAGEPAPDTTATPPEGLRRVAQRIPVRSLADTAATPSEPGPSDTADRDTDDQADPAADEVAAFEEAARFDDDALPPDDPADSRADPQAATSFAATYQEPEAADRDDPEEDGDEDDLDASGTHDGDDADRDTDRTLDEQTPDADAGEVAPPPPPTLDDPNDIRQVRRSLVENRKVMLPDVEELNTSLRMDRPAAAADLRASAFSEEAAANRSRFWLGLVTALMLFGILSALYLMGPAIADTFPAADPYVAAYRDFVDTSLDATAGMLEPVVAWLESL